MTGSQIFTCSGCHNVITGKENWENHKKHCKKLLEKEN